MTADWRKDLKQLYFPSGKAVSVIDIPKMKFLMVDGKGSPNTAKSFQGAIMALYSTAYTLKFGLKKTDPEKDFRIGPLEALWWNTDSGRLLMGNKEDWQWTAMIMVPDLITTDLVAAAKRTAALKKELAELPKLRLDGFKEGKVAQITYIGPYADEGPTIEMMHKFIQEKGGTLSGKHHEIYMSDPRRTSPTKLKTVIRQPFR